MRVTPRRLLCLRLILLVSGLAAVSQLSADDAPATPKPAPWVWTGDASGLQQLSMAELDCLYRRATVVDMPVGWFPGQVIAFTNMATPDIAKKMADSHWRGKHIEPDGSFINQWKRVKALSSHIEVGPSYVDGNPCLVFEYPRMTPLFGPMRDEYREIAPGLYLGRMYRRVPKCKFLGFNYLQQGASGCCESKLLAQEDSAPSISQASGSDR